VEIYENIVEGFSDGIRVSGPSPIVAGNDVSGVGAGVFLDSAPDAIVTRNRIHDMVAGVGISILGSSTRSVVTHNYISNSTLQGIGDESVGDNLLADNVIVNTPIGIRVSGAAGDIITRNLIEKGSVIGVSLVGGSGHRVHHNWFQYNDQQATDSSSGSAWDDGYPSGGNHWSDYMDNDLYRGILQNIPGPDGIGDTPYAIDADSRDGYPFYSEPAPGIPRELTARSSGGAVTLSWLPAPMADSYYLYRADTPTGFDFSSPFRLGNVTSWIDFSASTPGARFYILQGHNTLLNRTGATSNTAGKWTHQFAASPSSLSFPLAPYPWIDYAAPGWVNTTGEFLAATGADSFAYLEAGLWWTVPGDGGMDRTLRTGEGYLASFSTRTLVTFTGLPGAMIDYAKWPPYALEGFDPTTTAREVTATTAGNSVVLEWTQIPEIPTGNGTYQVYASRTPSGLRGYLGVDHDLLATVAATPAPRRSFTHAGALGVAAEWYYLVVPVRGVYWRGASTYSIGVVATVLPYRYSAIGLPLQPYANGTYLAPEISSLLATPGILGMQWFDVARQDWIAHPGWMPPGTYDAAFSMIMAVQIDVATPTRVLFTGV
jgi:hypothetical protein